VAPADAGVFLMSGQGGIAMRFRLVLSVGLLVALASSATPVSAAPPTCLGMQATQWLTAPGVLHGTAGDDVLVGTSGNDILEAHLTPGGVDLLCGRSGDDLLVIDGAGSIADAGSGRDEVYAFGGATARGGSGNDPWVYAQGSGSVAEGGSGNDGVYGVEASALFGGSGNDRVSNTQGAVQIDCGSGKDTVIPADAVTVLRCEQEGHP
jgi:Ca2+-binding RTX toxin-like protein